MEVLFLLDENIAAPLADKLDKAGHDVERVVDVNELGDGIDDSAICLYAAQEDRLVMEDSRLKPRPSGRGYSRQFLH